MNSLMIGAPKLDGLPISASQRGSHRQKAHRMYFRTLIPYRSLGAKASLRCEGKAHRASLHPHGGFGRATSAMAMVMMVMLLMVEGGDTTFGSSTTTTPQDPRAATWPWPISP
jgi:hypothetical protein